MARLNLGPGRGGAKSARRILIAGRVLEIMAEGGGYAQIVDEFGVPHHPETRHKMNAEEVAAWAHAAYLNDDAKRVGAARVEAELARIAYADAGDYFAWGPDGVAVKDCAGLTPDQRRAVAEVSETKTSTSNTVKVKLHDKIPALRALGQAYGLTVERHEIAGAGGGPIVTRIERVIVGGDGRV